MNSNAFAPIPVSGPDTSRKPRRDPNAPDNRPRRRATQAHSNAARERVIANNAAQAQDRPNALFSWEQRALDKARAEAAQFMTISTEQARELRALVYGDDDRRGDEYAEDRA